MRRKLDQITQRLNRLNLPTQPRRGMAAVYERIAELQARETPDGLDTASSMIWGILHA